MLGLPEASAPSGVRWRETASSDSAASTKSGASQATAAEPTPTDPAVERERFSGRSRRSESVYTVHTVHYGIQRHVLTAWRGLQRYASKLYHLIIWCLMLMSFMVANVILPVICGIQMLILDYVLAGESLTKRPWIWIFCACELCLVGHLMVNNTQLHAVRSGSFQWITYSWLISIKSCLLFFHVLPDLHVEEVDFARGSLKSTKNIVTILWLTPMFYTILTFRTLRELLQTGHTRKTRPHGTRHGTRELQRDLEEHSRMDVVLLTDMVWHVFIDMIDIIYMMFMSNPYDDGDSIMDPVFMKERPETVKQIRRAVGIIVFLGLFFHQQSFPRIGYVGASRAERGQSAALLMRQGSISSLQRTPTTPTPQQRGRMQRQGSKSSMTGSPSPSVGKSDSKPAAEYWVDVVKARKRSAIVSILMVDLPFLIIRTYLIMLSLNLQAEPDNHLPLSPLHGILPQVDKWWVKNILCLVLQAMQLRFVQQADVERSSNLCWWDVQISVTRAADVGAKRRKADQSKLLTKKWRDLDRGKLQAAMEDTGGVTTTSGSERTGTDDEGRHKGPQDLPAPQVQRGFSESSATQNSRTRSAAPTNSTRRSSAFRLRRCLCCCRRRPCRCCNCDCSSGILTHALMGSLLGWLIAKVDFTQAFTDLVMGLHTER